MLNRWHSCIARLESEMPSEQFRPWIKPLRFIAYNESDHQLRVGIKSAYKLNLIKDQFEHQLLAAVRQEFAPETTITLELLANDGPELEIEPENDPLEAIMAEATAAHSASQTASYIESGDPATQSGTPPTNYTDNAPADAPSGPPTTAAGHRQQFESRQAAAALAGNTSSSTQAGATPRQQAQQRAQQGSQQQAPEYFEEDSHYDRASRLRRDLTMNEFVEGRGNQMALAAAMQIIERPGHLYNPLVVVGGVGLGKTHLLHAVGNAMHAQRPSRRIQYVHAQEYFEEMVRAIQRKNPQEFKQRYQNLDLLLIDDIQFLGGKERTQEEFFYTFEALFSSKKQLMITCDTYPKDLGEFQDRLKSRLGSGLIVEIDLPDIETRTAILLKKAEGLNSELPNDVAQFIAKHLRSNVRELEGALLRVIAFARFRSRPISVELAREALNDLLELNRPPISIEQIQKIVADHYKIKVADMYSKRRPAHIALARQVAMYFAKEVTQKSFPEIGEAFGGRDHTTVMHAVKKIAELRQKDSDENRNLHVLEQSLRG